MAQEFQTNAQCIIFSVSATQRREAEGYFTALKKRPDRVFALCFEVLISGCRAVETILAAQLLYGACKKCTIPDHYLSLLQQALLVHNDSPNSIKSPLHLAMSAAVLRKYCTMKLQDSSATSSLCWILDEIQRILPSTMCLRVLAGVAEVALTREFWSKQSTTGGNVRNGASGAGSGQGAFPPELLPRLIVENTTFVVSLSIQSTTSSASSDSLGDVHISSQADIFNSTQCERVSLVAQWMEVLMQDNGPLPAAVMTTLDSLSLSILLQVWTQSDLIPFIIECPCHYMTFFMAHLSLVTPEDVSTTTSLTTARDCFESCTDIVIGLLHLATELLSRMLLSTNSSQVSIQVGSDQEAMVTLATNTLEKVCSFALCVCQLYPFVPSLALLLVLK